MHSRKFLSLAAAAATTAASPSPQLVKKWKHELTQSADGLSGRRLSHLTTITLLPFFSFFVFRFFCKMASVDFEPVPVTLLQQKKKKRSEEVSSDRVRVVVVVVVVVAAAVNGGGGGGHDGAKSLKWRPRVVPPCRRRVGSRAVHNNSNTCSSRSISSSRRRNHHHHNCPTRCSSYLPLRQAHHSIENYSNNKEEAAVKAAGKWFLWARPQEPQIWIRIPQQWLPTAATTLCRRRQSRLLCFRIILIIPILATPSI